MHVDIGNALGAEPRLTRDALDRLDDRVADAHDRIERGRADADHGYAALNLPETVDPAAIRATVDRFDDTQTVLTVGEGPEIAVRAGGDERAFRPVDARPIHRLPDEQKVRQRFCGRPGTGNDVDNGVGERKRVQKGGNGRRVDVIEDVDIEAGAERPGECRRAESAPSDADRHDLPALEVPVGVPGRFSVLSATALPIAALAGHDIDALLEGARAEATRLAGSLFESPAYAYGATCYALERRGAGVNAMMPYAESLESFAEWFAQLWAESLGKDAVGQTPARALGATDQHSQLQLYRAGPRDKLVTFVRPRERPDAPIPETDLDGLAYLGGGSLGDLLDAEFRATEASLAAAGCPNVRIELDRIDERGLGELLYGMEAACVLYGELAGIETFTQPAVEWGKRAARGLLGGGDFAEAEAVGEKRRLVVE